jgi:hypothetical protein
VSGGQTDAQRKKDLAVWSVVRQAWYVPRGRFEFWAGNSSRRLPLRAEVDVDEGV